MNSFHNSFDKERSVATQDASRIADQHVSQGRKFPWNTFGSSRQACGRLGGGLSHASHNAYTGRSSRYCKLGTSRASSRKPMACPSSQFFAQR